IGYSPSTPALSKRTRPGVPRATVVLLLVMVPADAVIAQLLPSVQVWPLTVVDWFTRSEFLTRPGAENADEIETPAEKVCRPLHVFGFGSLIPSFPPETAIVESMLSPYVTTLPGNKTVSGAIAAKLAPDGPASGPMVTPLICAKSPELVTQRSPSAGLAG